MGSGHDSKYASKPLREAKKNKFNGMAMAKSITYTEMVQRNQNEQFMVENSQLLLKWSISQEETGQHFYAECEKQIINYTKYLLAVTTLTDGAASYSI